MALEATVVCMDNSEWTRNGDYSPSRFQAQADAINLLAGAKTQANVENTVGLLTIAGKSPRVLVTPTPDLGKILNSLHGLDIEGEANVSSAVQIAQLALKHRQNKNQRQRIVLFICSPLSETKDILVKIAKKLKKNNVAVDVISFGCEENTDKLEAFQETVNSGDNSHLVAVPVGTILSDQLFNTPIFQVEGSGGGYGGGGEGGVAAEGAGGFDFGVDPSLDPELALALRVSVEEERARQSAAAAAAAGEENHAGPSGTAAEAPAGGAAAPGGATPGSQAPSQHDASTAEAMDEEELLQQALAMSMEVDEAQAAPAVAPTPAASSQPAATPVMPPAPHKPEGAGPDRGPAAQAVVEEEDMGDLDPELQAALQMSMLDSGEAGGAGGPTQGDMQDFISSLGEDIDMADPELAAELARFQQGKKEGSKEEEGKKEDK